MNLTISPPVRFVVALTASVLILSGCSGSGNSSSPDIVNTTTQSTSGANTGGANSQSGEQTTDSGSIDAITNDTTDSTTSETTGDTTVGTSSDTTSDAANSTATDSTTGGANNDTTDSNTNDATSGTADGTSAETTGGSVQEPVQPKSTRVSFDITVPAYVSNALQVQLIWGDKNLNGIWLADESWRISDEFPTNTEELLVVKFSDDNGDIILGTFESNFRTESSTSQSFSITASDFDTSWDSDGDGVSNLEESITGGNPLVFDIILNDELKAAFPGRQTLFGEDISRIPNPDFFHDNTLMSWSYEIVDGQLVNSAFETPLSHQIAWQRYQKLTLPEDRKIINLVKFLAGSSNTSDGYVITYGPDATVPGQAEVQLQLNEHFVANLFDVHRNQKSNDDSDTQTLLHLHGYVLEAAHKIKFDHEYDVSTYSLGIGSRMLWDSPTREFYWNFWEGEVFDTWLELKQGTQSLQTKMLETFPDQFVSASATRFPSSDFSESFVFFVTLDEMPDVGTIAGAEKIRWFWTQPEYVNARDFARAAF